MGCCTRKGFTYVIESGGRIKIGRASNVAQRIGDIQAMCPSIVTLLATAPGGSLERHLHRVCDEWRLHGEWFTFDAWRHIAHLFATGVCAACSLGVREKAQPGRGTWKPSTFNVSEPVAVNDERPRRDQSDIYSSSAAARVVAAIRGSRGRLA